MDDATQKLVDEELFLAVDRFQSGLIDKMELIEAAERWRHADRTALEAARAEVDAYERDAVERSEQGRTDYDYEQKIAALEAAQRPVGPEALTDVLMEVTTWPRPSAHRLASDILARLSVRERPPVSPDCGELQARLDEAEEKLASLEAGCVRLTRDELVYDEEKIARWLRENHDPCITEGGCDFGYPDYRHDAAALVAALRGGELTREEESRG